MSTANERGQVSFTSVTFRKYTAEEIIEFARRNGIFQIELGGDVHLPPGDAVRAEKLRDEALAKGVRVLSYGSYYMLLENMDFQPVLESASAVGAQGVRIWAGSPVCGRTDCDEAEFARAVEELRSVCRAAERQGLTIHLEKHRGTLTQDPDQALRLMEAAAMPNLKIYWQPNPELDVAENERAIRLLLPHISHVHTFSWTEKNKRLPLEARESDWRQYIRLLGPRTYILEFVKDDDEMQFIQDVITLRQWIQEG